MTLSTFPLRDHKFLGLTQSLCPTCLAVVPAKIIAREGRVYFQKFCIQHGHREDFVCSDERWFDRLDYNVPGRQPLMFGSEPNRGCPYDCGLCTEHEQHTCVAVLEITSSCNLTCPMCYAASGPGGQHLSLEECRSAIDRLVEVEGRPEILQLSGGEPTVHPQFHEILEYACRQPIDQVMINTNGIRIAHDREFCERLARWPGQAHVYLQMDGFSPHVYPQLRGEDLLDTKLTAVERLGDAGILTTLVATLQTEVNLEEVGPLVEFGRQRRWITGISFQPATYVGRCFEPDQLERRITFPDVIRALETQSGGMIQQSDIFPVPCAHPNAHTLCYTFRVNDQLLPITRFVDMDRNFDLLANGISLTREQAKNVVDAFLQRQACGPDCDCLGSTSLSASTASTPSRSNGLVTLGSVSVQSVEQTVEAVDSSESNLLNELASQFFSRALAENISAGDMFRITTTSFMDAYNFDLRQLMKSCVHHVLPSGHIIPFDAYNTLYRNGHLPLPELSLAGPARAGRA